MLSALTRTGFRADCAGWTSGPGPPLGEIGDAVPVRYRSLVLLATFGGLRWGELVGLRRENVDLNVCVVRVIETTAELDRGGLVLETPESKAGRRMSRSRPILYRSCAGI